MNRRKYIIFTIVATIAMAADQLTKVLARQSLRNAPVKTVVDGYFDLRYSENAGVAFGMMQGLPFGRLLLALLAVGAFLLVIYYLAKTEPEQTRLHVALGFIGGGAVGNLIDRIAFGRVTDFIVWKVGVHEWPAFNIADAALVIGVALMALDMLPGKGKTKKAADAAR